MAHNRPPAHIILAVLLLAGADSCLLQKAAAQIAPHPGYVPPSNPNDPFGKPQDPHDIQLENSRRRAREIDRQKRMVDDANRLVSLTAQYRARITEHGTPTAEDSRLLQDIEKLARSVKDRMRGL